MVLLPYAIRVYVQEMLDLQRIAEMRLTLCHDVHSMSSCRVA